MGLDQSIYVLRVDVPEDVAVKAVDIGHQDGHDNAEHCLAEFRHADYDESVFEPAISSNGQWEPGVADHYEFFYWRANWPLHRWMEKLYKERGGTYFIDGIMTGNLRLTLDDIICLQLDVASGRLPTADTESYSEEYWQDYHQQQNLLFCERAEEAINAGDRLVYEGNW